MATGCRPVSRTEPSVSRPRGSIVLRNLCRDLGRSAPAVWAYDSGSAGDFKIMHSHRWLLHAFRLGTLLGVAFGVAACASFSPDAGMRVVDDVVTPSLNAHAAKLSTDEDVIAARARTQQLLKAPLSAGSAVRVALLNNKGLQVAYNQLGIAEAVMVEASRPPS